MRLYALHISLNISCLATFQSSSHTYCLTQHTNITLCVCQAKYSREKKINVEQHEQWKHGRHQLVNLSVAAVIGQKTRYIWIGMLNRNKQVFFIQELQRWSRMVSCSCFLYIFLSKFLRGWRQVCDSDTDPLRHIWVIWCCCKDMVFIERGLNFFLWRLSTTHPLHFIACSSPFSWEQNLFQHKLQPCMYKIFLQPNLVFLFDALLGLTQFTWLTNRLR